MNVIKLMKKFLATLLLAFVVVAMVPACSSSDEQEDPANGEQTCEDSEREWPECLPI
jgi:uncharacterized lipoprotein